MFIAAEEECETVMIDSNFNDNVDVVYTGDDDGRIMSPDIFFPPLSQYDDTQIIQDSSSRVPLTVFFKDIKEETTPEVTKVSFRLTSSDGTALTGAEATIIDENGDTINVSFYKLMQYCRIGVILQSNAILSVEVV